MYPGLIFTAGALWNLLQKLNIPIHVQEVCVFTAPLFSAFTALATYALMKEVRGPGAGLASALLISTVPSYISRSVAGSYDLEAVAIFALVLVFYLYIKTLNTGSLVWAAALFLSYLYMVASWGGYSFIVNLLPIHCLACIVFGRISSRLYVAYAPFVVLGTLAALNIPVIGFNAVLTSEHFASFIVFGILHVALAVQYAKSVLPPRVYAAGLKLLWGLGTLSVGTLVAVVIAYVSASPTFGWTGRSLSLLDPTYASKYIPIIASVSEHQPPAWASYFTDLHIAGILAPAGLLACFRPLTDASLFMLLYGVTAVYFSGVMVRLMLVLAPAACCLGGLGLSELLTYIFASIASTSSTTAEEGKQPQLAKSDSFVSDKGAAAGAGGGISKQQKKAGSSSSLHKASVTAAVAAASKTKKKDTSKTSSSSSSSSSSGYPLPRDVAAMALVGVFLLLASYVKHTVYVSGELYSAPSIVLQSKRGDGSVKIYDDFREAYAWMRFNTAPDAKFASWWDYGYQTTGMANRTVLVDNNTWNNTHIATMAKALASTEKKGWQILKSLDVDYIFVVFGGLIGYPSDDINKFLWMIRIANGVYPEVKESDFLGAGSHYRVDKGASKTMLNSLMYRLSYYRFAEVGALYGTAAGHDRVRNAEIGLSDFSLKYFEEAFTSEHWMMRVYRVLDHPNRERLLPNPRRQRAKAGNSGGKRSSSSKGWL
jgi:dolichyl-diphosphooligosaccharide--protein glycosyltransferase